MEATGSVGQVRTILDTYTVAPEDRIILLDVTKDFTVTIPNPAACRGRWLSLYDMVNTDPLDIATIAIAGSGSFVTTAGLASTIDLNVAGEHLQVYSTGSAWFVISEATS